MRRGPRQERDGGGRPQIRPPGSRTTGSKARTQRGKRGSRESDEQSSPPEEKQGQSEEKKSREHLSDFDKHFWSHSLPSAVLPRSYLACGHEKGEDEDEGALRHGQPVGLLKGEEDGSIQAGFGRAAETRGVFLNLSARGRQNTKGCADLSFVVKSNFTGVLALLLNRASFFFTVGYAFPHQQQETYNDMLRISLVSGLQTPLSSCSKLEMRATPDPAQI